MSLLASVAALADPAAAKATKPAAEVGTTLIGDRDSAVGLYLLPWKDEAPSDIDRPPLHFELANKPVDPTTFAARIQREDDNAAYRRVRLEPKF
ncbi:hypothetical protein [Solimonas marina]|uniref:Uncharacterized protein n=1 Tax=Solimonas marina TaxID=2714601 RepID=A0A970B5I6_9GAMM|nr:hypothetical protein [Solimonas marina]NKF23437.1 hypothetical protein [Solimonas marina]